MITRSEDDIFYIEYELLFYSEPDMKPQYVLQFSFSRNEKAQELYNNFTKGFSSIFENRVTIFPALMPKFNGVFYNKKENVFDVMNEEIQILFPQPEQAIAFYDFAKSTRENINMLTKIPGMVLDAYYGSVSFIKSELTHPDYSLKNRMKKQQQQQQQCLFMLLLLSEYKDVSLPADVIYLIVKIGMMTDDRLYTLNEKFSLFKQNVSFSSLIPTQNLLHVKIQKLKRDCTNHLITSFIEMNIRDKVSEQNKFAEWWNLPLPEYREGAVVKDLIYTDRYGKEVETSEIMKQFFSIIEPAPEKEVGFRK